MLKKRPGVVAHVVIPVLWEAETRGSGFAASLSYLVRPPQPSETLFQNKNKVGPGVVAHACNPSTLGGGDRRIRVLGQPQLSLSLSLST